MSAPPPELARLVRAHRIVHRPDPELVDRVRSAVHTNHRRRETRRWIGGALVGASIGLAAILVLRCVAVSPSQMHAEATGVEPQGAAYDKTGEPASGATTPVAPKPVQKPAPVVPEVVAPTAPTPTPSVQRPVAKDDAASEPTTKVEREVSMLRQAEVALHDDPEAALATLRRHAREFPKTSLGVEREALSVLALCAAGQRIEGRGRRAAFLQAHATSVYAARVRAACEDG